MPWTICLGVLAFAVQVAKALSEAFLTPAAATTKRKSGGGGFFSGVWKCAGVRLRDDDRSEPCHYSITWLLYFSSQIQNDL